MRAARGVRVFIKLAEKREKRKTIVASMRATGRANVWVTDWARVRVSRESKRNDWTDNHAKARAGKWLKRE